MSDEQILKRLAEIEAKSVHGANPDGSPRYGLDDYAGAWNPLEHWSDLGPLIEKHEISLSKCELSGWVAWCGPDECFHESLPHAICLAIIEASSGEKG